MNQISLCITSYYKDIIYLDRLWPYLESQTICPAEIILYCSGIKSINIPSITINKQLIQIKTIIDYEPQLQTVARNVCADHANCDTIIFFDIDDIPHPQKLEATSYHINNYDFLVHSFTKSIIKHEMLLADIPNIKTTTNLYIDPNPRSTNIESDIKRPITHGHLAIKKHVLEKVRFDTNLYYVDYNGNKFCSGEDGRFCQDLVRNGYKGIFLDFPLIIYT